MKNKYRVTGDVVSVLVKCKGKRYFTRFNSQHLSRMLSINGTWYVRFTKGMPYVLMNKPSLGFTYRMHRVITDAPKNLVVDHRNHKTLDNTDDNLRVCTHTVNMRNKRKYKSNKSGYPGVKFQKKDMLWVVGLNRKYLGCTKNFVEAVYMRKREELKEGA